MWNNSKETVLMGARTTSKSFKFHKTGLKIKKSSGRLLVTNWKNIVTRCKFLVGSLYNVNDAAIYGAIYQIWLSENITDRSQYKFGGKLAFCMRFGTFFYDESKARWDEMFVLTLIFYFKSKSKRNLVAKVLTKPEFLVAKEKMLVALATILPLVASKCVHVRKKHVVIGGKHDMFCHQTFEVWSRRLLCTWFVFAQKKFFARIFRR